MKKPLICLLPAICLLVLSGCLNTRDQLPALWFYTFSGGPALDRDTLLTPASFAEIRADGSYTCDFGHFEYGTWSRKDQKLSLTNQQNITTSFSLSGLTRNGFGLKPFDELPQEWKSCFFDEQDCRKANDLIGDIFHHKTIAWAHTDNKYKMFIGAFQQMEQFLR